MTTRGTCTIRTILALLGLAFPANAQSVISARSGVIHFLDGDVYLGDRPLEAHLGRFETLPEGAELRTGQGRAELLLTPGVFLRIGEKSRIRMKANDLADTQVELLNGSAILESTESNPDTSVTLICTAWKTRFPTKGLYRIDSDPPRLWVYRGKAQAFAEAGAPVAVDAGMDLPFAAVLVPERSDAPPADALTEWANGRSQSIIADNAITAQIDEDPASRASGLDNFAYFPFLGVSSLISPSPYSSLIPSQPGFSSIYLPGYTYRPLLLGVMGGGYGYGGYGYGGYGYGGYSYGGYSYGGYSYGGYRGYVPSPPPRMGSSPGVGIAIPGSHAPIWRPAPSHPLPHPVPHAGHR